ncbi:gamma-glutamyltransferase family protein [Bordetella petrii]|uniref:Ggt2 protein n=1 Tax=Bordetella petrii (strain ATCC BAA-461 / DSM 12804 / CCUG 43448 / CIP 107267 / Se-1111R) TaxID=340100 RepID=A9IDQ0_BORPD|nr:gamma-glutamyltransferase family protein [Bordetella petrii]CAP41587.1 ggt2 [Bordetella petrii]
MAESFTTRPEIKGTMGVVSSTHWLGSQVAMGVLEKGGNAFDAAVAGGFVLQIVEPHLNGPGGEVPILFWSEQERRARSLCGQGTAPALASAQYFRDRGLEQVPGIGSLPAVVPGAFGAWLTLLRDYGTLELADVLRPAIDYAQHGFPAVPRLSAAILAVAPLFRNEWTSSHAVWLPDGKVPKPDELLRTPAIAATYRRLIDEAHQHASDRVGRIDAALDAWYRGFVADEIDAFFRNEAVRDTTGERNTGLLRKSDLEQWQPAYEAPMQHDHGRYSVLKCGVWSQGPVMLQQLSMLAQLPIDTCDPLSFDFVHTVAEVAKLAFADRLAWYADPAFVDVPLDALLSPGYAAERIKLLASTASRVLRPGSPRGLSPVLPDLSVGERTLGAADTRYGVGEPTFAQLPPVDQWLEQEIFVGDTCHIDVIDRWGNMVAATPSGGWLSSSPVIPGLGFSISTRLQMTWLDEGVPGVLTPGKRPSTTLSPGLVLRDGEPYMVFGTPGGDQQDQWATTFLLRHMRGMNLQEAIDCPSWHIDHFPGSFWPRTLKLNRLIIESRFPAEILEQLRVAGHDVQVGGAWSEGRISVCTQEMARGGARLLRAAANPRGMQGYAVGR